MRSWKTAGAIRSSCLRGTARRNNFRTLWSKTSAAPSTRLKRLGDELPSDDPYIIPWDIFNDALIDDWDWDWEQF